MEIEKEHTDAIKIKYNFEDWKHQVKIPSKIAKRYLPNHDEIFGLIFEERRAIPNTNYTFTDYFKHIKNENVRVAITISKHNNINEAHMSLLDIILSCTDISIPFGTEKGLYVGDLSYCVQKQCYENASIQTSVFFSRNNILIQVESIGQKDYPIGDIAKIIDKQIISQLI